MEIDWIACGKRIQTLRESLKLTQEEFAEIVGVSPNSMSRIERGKQHTTVSVLRKMARTFRVSIDYLLDGIEVYMDSPQVQESLTVLGEIGNQLSNCTPKQLHYVSETLLPALLLRDELEQSD